jgi:hypothetical protein
MAYVINRCKKRQPHKAEASVFLVETRDILAIIHDKNTPVIYELTMLSEYLEPKYICAIII